MLTKLVAAGFILVSVVPRASADESVKWVWSGAVTRHSAVVKAKVDAPGTLPVNLRVGERTFPVDDRYRYGVVVFHLDGLDPATDYEYRLEIGDRPTLAGRFQTFEDGPMSFKFVFGSCATTGSNHHVFETMESLGPLFTLHMGDFHYENIEENDPAKYHRAFDEVLASERQSSLYRSAPIAYVWDDHDYGPDDSDKTHRGKQAALATYYHVVPHYPIDRQASNLTDIRQAFSVGRVRVVMTDVRSHRTPQDAPDGPDKTMLGVNQREWLLEEIEAAGEEHALVIWVNPVPWIAEVGSGHGWGSYHWERQLIADRIREMGMMDRLLMLSGDAHMVAMDDGTNSNFATDAPEGERGFPVVHAAPFDRFARHKGGPYSHGKAGRRILFGLIKIQQFGLANVRDDGEVLEVELTGRNEDGELLDGMSMVMRCEDNGCRVLD